MPGFFTTDLYKILQTLYKEDIEQLKGFAVFLLQSEFHDVLRLLDWVEDHFDGLAKGESMKEDATLEQMLKVLFPHAKTKDSEQEAARKLRDAKAKCLSLTKEFLVWQEIQSSLVRNKLALANAFRKRNLRDLYEKELQEIGLIFRRNDDFYDEDPQGDRLDLLAEVHRMEYLKFGKGKKDFKMDTYPKAFFEHVFSERLLQISMQMNWEKGPIEAKPVVYLQKETLNYVSKHFSALSPRVQLLFLLCQCELDNLSNRKNRLLLALKLWEQEKNSLSTLEEYHTFLYLARHFTVWANKTETSTEGFNALERVFQRFNRKKIQLAGGMPLVDSINFITVFTNKGDFETAEKFLDQFSGAVQEEYREIGRECGRLIICVKRETEEDWEEAGNIVSPGKNLALDDKAIDALVRIQRAKVYYHRDEMGVLESYLESFNQFIKRHRDEIGEQTDKFNNFVKGLTLLRKFNLDNNEKYREIDEKKILKLIQKFQSPMPIGEEEWLKSEAYKLLSKEQ